MKKTFAIVMLSALLSACAGMKQGDAPAGTSAAADKTADKAARARDRRAAAKAKAKARALAEQDPLPLVNLNEDILFKIMTSEIAFQRGQWQSSFVTLMATAQQTRDPRLAKRAAEMAIAARAPREALSAVRLWTELSPRSTEAQQNYLGLIMLDDNLADIEPVLAQQLKDASAQSRPALILQLQGIMLRAKDKPAAFAMLDRILAPYTALVETHLALSQSAFANGDVPRARREALAAQRIKPDSELAILTLAQVTPDNAEAMKLVADYLRKYPKAREVRVAYARSLIEQKQYDAARAQFETILKDEPEDVPTLFALGVLSAQTDRLDDAENYLKRFLAVLAAQPDNERDPTQALLLLSQIAEQRGDLAGALKWLDQVEPGDAYVSVQVRRAQLQVRQGNIDAASQTLQQAQDEAENDREKIILIESQAQVLRDNQRAPEAAKVLTEGLTRFPNNPDLLYDYAMVLEKMGDLAQMEAMLRKTIAVAPTNQHAYNALGYSLADRNERLPEALNLITTAHTMAPDDAFINDSLGWVQYRMGNLKQAETTLRQAYAARPDVEIGVHLGEVLWVSGNKEEALKVWREASKKEPNNELLASTLSRLKARL